MTFREMKDPNINEAFYAIFDEGDAKVEDPEARYEELDYWLVTT